MIKLIKTLMTFGIYRLPSNAGFAKSVIYFFFVYEKKYDAYRLRKLKSIKVGFDELQRANAVIVCP